MKHASAAAVTARVGRTGMPGVPVDKDGKPNMQELPRGDG